VIHYPSSSRHDAELVERIVSRVRELLDYKDLSITQFPVGLESHVEKVIGYIENHSSKVCMIGIWGMGGSGKTTIAKAIYNRIYRPFIGKSLTQSIREFWDPKTRPIDLQESLLCDVLKPKPDMKFFGIGRTRIKDKLSRKKLLIVLDDMNEFDYLENVCGNREWFGQGTVIIITTRDVNVLNLLKVDYVYKMDHMNENESLELFSWHAFGEAKPRKDFNELARHTVAYCGGLPQALTILGSFLCDKTMKEWESASSKLKRIPMDQVQNILKIIFDGLRNHMEKDVFLDICFSFSSERGYVTDTK